MSILGVILYSIGCICLIISTILVFDPSFHKKIVKILWSSSMILILGGGILMLLSQINK